MKILDFLCKETIVPSIKARDKQGVLEEITTPVAIKAGVAKGDLMNVLIEREHLGSTGIGGGVGIPHGKMKNLDKLVLGVGISKDGIDFESMDNRPVYIFFLLVTPENSTGIHLKLLAHISRMLRSEVFKQKLLKAASSDAIMEVIKEEDQEF